MANYKYIKSDNSVGYVDAPDANTAIANAPDRATHSGVQLVERYTPPATTPTPTTTTNNTPKNAGYTYRGQDGLLYNSQTGEQVSDPNSYQNDLAASQADLDRQQELQRQSLIDVITKKYDSKVAGIEQTGAEELARTRALNLRSGLIESPQGSTELGNTKAKTQAAKDANEAAKADEITQQLLALDGIYYQRKRDLTQDKLQELKTNQDLRANEIALRDERRKPATTILASLAKNGTTYEQFKLDPNYDNVKNDFTDQELQALFISNAPSTSFLSDKPEIIGSTAIWFQKQADGSIKQVKLDLGVSDNSIEQVVKTDQGVLVINKDGTYKNIGGANDPSETDVKNTDAKKIAGFLDSSTGNDGKVSPEDYLKAKRAWVQDHPTSAGDFDKYFVSYVNPTNLSSYGLDQETFNALKKPSTFILQQ